MSPSLPLGAEGRSSYLSPQASLSRPFRRRLVARKVASLSHLSSFAGADCLSRSPVGRTPLHVAAAMGRADCISLLLKYGASINTKDAKGVSPVALARHLNHKHSTQRMLLHHWAVKSGTERVTGANTPKAFPRARSGSGSKKDKVEVPLGLSAHQS